MRHRSSVSAARRDRALRRLVPLLVAIQLAVTVLPLSAHPASAAPQLGGQLFATGGPVEVEVLSASAGFTSELWLFEPIESRVRIATNRDVGRVVQLGTFPAGTELVFGIHVLNTGNDFRMGPASRNPDNQVHAQVDFLEAGRAIVGFEDLFGGGDRDYNDNMFEFRGGIAPEVPKGPTADAGPDQAVTEGDLVTLDATASTDPDTDAPQLTYRWEPAGASGPPITLSSATSPTPSFQTLDDGTYRFTLTVSDGERADSDEVKVTVGNGDPVLATQADPAYAGGVALITASFSDPGALDTHTGHVDWGDGSPAVDVPVSAQGTGWGSYVASHVYATAGRYTVTATVIDDDGGTDTTTTTTVDVLVPVALWHNSHDADAAMESTSGVVTVEGLTHSNDDLRIRGGAKTFIGRTEFVRTLDVGGAVATFTPAAVQTGVKPFPITFAMADYRPGGPAAVEAGSAYHNRSSSCGSSGVWNVTGTQLSSGIYYVSCSVHLTGNPLGGTITLVAEGDIQVSGTGADFDPFVDGLLFLSGSSTTSSIKVDASNSVFFGYSFSERGRVTLSGSGNAFYCGILADRIDIAAQALRVHGSGCTNPARTVAPPALVPTLAVAIAVDHADTLPGQALRHTATVRNAGATLLVPGVVGVENLGTSPVTVTGASLTLESLDATDGAWHPLPGTVTLVARPNPVAGVTYPSTGNPFAGTVVQPGRLASWGYQAIVTLAPADVARLLDPARTLAIRNVSTFDVTPDTVPVRRLFRFGDDFAPQLRALGGDLTAVKVTLIPPDGDPTVFAPASKPALARLKPGDAVDVHVDSTVQAPAARSTTETAAAYVARLATFDGTRLVGAASASGAAGIGRILGPQQLAQTTRHLPVVSLDLTGPADIEAGHTAAWTISLANGGSAEARTVVATDTLAGTGNLPVSGVPGTLAAGATGTGSASYAVPANRQAALADSAAATWSDAAGNAYGAVDDQLSTTVIAPRSLSVLKTAEVLGTAGDQEIRYELSVTNLGDQTVSGATLTDTIDPYTTLVGGTITTSQGTVTLGDEAGEPTLTVAIGTIAGRSTVVVGFRVAVQAPLPEGVTSISNQAQVSSAELPAVLSDDPDQPGATDPTRVPASPGGVGGGGGGGGGENLPRPSLGDPTPEDGAVVTEPLTIRRVITPPDGQTIASWTITSVRAGTSGETVLASGTGTAAPAAQSLLALADPGPSVTAEAAFDPTRLPNGTYLITVTAQASGGGIQRATTSVVVDGQLKLGRYETTYQDLNVGVGGLPMQVLRTYDSFDRSVGDFGVGWRVEVANFRVSVNRPLGREGWTRDAVNCGLIFCQLRYRDTIPHYVTVTWPDGRQEIFDFQPQDGSTFFAPLTAAGFTGRPNTTSTLEVEGDTSLAFYGDGNLYGGAFGSGPVYDPQRFRLTARDGTAYVLDRSLGLVSATDRNGNTLTVSDDGIVSSLGRSIEFTRDPQGRISQIKGPGDETLSYQYDPAGDLVAFTDELERTFHYVYDDHRLLVSKDPGGQPFRTVAYDDDGRLASITDGENHTTTFSSDVGQRRDVITDPTGDLTTIVTYDPRGNIVRTDRTFDGRTLTTTATFDGLDRPTSETDPLHHSVNYVWNEHGNLVSATDAEHRTWAFTYGSFGLLQTVTSPDHVVVLRLGYDPDGNLVSEQRADADPITYTWTGGRLTAIHDGAGHTIGIVPNDQGQVASITTADGRTRSFTYNDSGRTLTVTEPDTGVSRFTYDDAGNLLTATDALSRVRRYGYDEFHHVVTEMDPSLRTTTYTYDDAGRVVSRSDRNSQTVGYAYDAAGRLTTKTLPGGVVTTYAYDPLGRPTTITGTDGRIDYTWDDANRLVGQRTRGVTGSSQPDVSLGFGYDDSDQRTSVAAPWGTTGFRFDARGRLDAVDRPGGGTFDFGYDDLDRVVAIDRPNGVDDLLAWTDTDQLLSRTSSLGATVVNRASYAYGDGFLRTSLTDLAGAHAYGYDGLGRLSTATHPAGSGLANESYTYNTASDRTSWAGSPAASVAYTADRLTRDGTFDYAYDLEGNLVRRIERATSRITTYDWNADHLLTAIHYPDGTTSRYRYDPLGRRIGVDDAGLVRRFVWDGANVAAEYDGSNTLTASYVTTQDAGMVLAARRGSAWETYLQDGLGSTVAVTDESGAVTRRQAYDAYGRPSGSPANQTYGWTGHQYDARSGLTYARARYYDPAVGRFISEDAVPSQNAYQYASCNPTNLVDSTGLQAIVERSLLDRVRQGITEALASEVESFVCQELVEAAILGLGGGPNALGQIGEQVLGDAIGANALPQQNLPGRRPDFRVSLFDYFESKNATRISGRSVDQLIDTANIVIGDGGQYVVVTRASTAEKLINSTGRLGTFFRSTPGMFIVGCLPG